MQCGGVGNTSTDDDRLSPEDVETMGELHQDCAKVVLVCPYLGIYSVTHGLAQSVAQ